MYQGFLYKYFQWIFLAGLVINNIACGSGGGSSSSGNGGSSLSSSSSNSSSSSSSSSSSTGIVLADIEYLSAGDATTSTVNEEAFSMPPPSFGIEDEGVFKQGNIIFRNERKGTGPLINNGICQGCHVKDGRAVLVKDETEVMRSMLFKLSLGQNEQGDDIPEPTYGFQLQTLGLADDGNFVPASGPTSNLTGEAFPFTRYEMIDGSYPDGAAYQLRKPIYYFKDLAYGDFAEGLKVSPRLAPPMFGLGLLEAITEDDIKALADPQDENQDGISGKIKLVFDQTQQKEVLGRFGWKMSTGSVLQQASGAFLNDMGVSNPFVKSEPCEEGQTACQVAADAEINTGDNPDIDERTLAFVEFYSRTLAVPQRRGYDTENKTWEVAIEKGQALFKQVNCNACHVEYFKTGDARESILGTSTLIELSQTGERIEALSDQHIWPYTDLLLHDMGGSCEPIARETSEGVECSNGSDCLWVQRCEGLADGRPDGSASGTEWRTTALWGIGLTKTVSPDATFLHDGRARTIEEAILWHGGEAEDSLNDFKNLTAQERADLLSFLDSL